jgi:hypothetical protein
MIPEHPAVVQLRHDIEVFKERKRRLEAGEMPGVEADDGKPPLNFDRRAEIAKADAKIVELSDLLKSVSVVH